MTINSARRWLRRHQKISLLLTVLSFLFVFLPPYISDVWALFSDQPLMLVLNSKLGFQTPAFSIMWITTPIGLVLLFIIIYLLATGKQQVQPSTATQLQQHLIKITEPVDNSRVEFKHNISGFIDPPAEWVQLLVGANDGLWHVQPEDARVNGRSWHGTCQFGNSAKDSAGKSYTTVAVTGAKKLPKGTKVEPIPENLTQSNWVNVRRDFL